MRNNLICVSASLLIAVALTSCSQEDVLPGEGGMTTFTVKMPDGIGTRTFGEGSEAKNLFVAIEDTEGNILFSSFTDGDKNGMEVEPVAGGWTVKVSLVKQKSYNIICWAQNGTSTDKGNIYEWNATDKTITVDYSAMDNFQEARDAFYKKQSFQADGQQHDVTLVRPFAQINVGTSDFAAFKNAGGIDSFGISIEGVANTLNLEDGTVGIPEETILASTSLSAASDEVFPEVGSSETFTYLGMAYVLVGNNRSIANVKLNAQGDKNFGNYASVPVEANYRTNIYGALLTNPEVFNVSILPAFNEPANNIEKWDGVSKTPVTPVNENGVNVYTVNLPSEFAWVMENASNNDKVMLARDIDLQNHPIRGLGRASRDNADDANAFSGVIDGQNHVIRNFNSTNVNDKYGVGLVEVAKNATIKNVSVSGGSLNSKDFAAGIVGCTKGGCVIENCHVENMSVNAEGAAAGIVARLYGSNDIVRNCTSKATVKGSEKVGGITAITVDNTEISNCENYGTVAGGNAGVGGILGFANSSVITDCKNFGSVGTVTDKYVGGILGYAQRNSAKVENCINSGEIKGNNAGGIFGIVGSFQDIDILRCINKGEVTGVALAAGIASGHGTGTISGCVNDATVRATGENGFAAGIVAQKNGGTIDNCDGGTAAITGFGAARILASALTGPDKTINMSNIKDVDDTDLPTIFVMGPWTAWGQVKVLSGTLHGDPCADLGLGTTTLTISEDAGWDIMDNPVGSWRKNKDTGVWYRI